MLQALENFDKKKHKKAKIKLDRTKNNVYKGLVYITI